MPTVEIISTRITIDGWKSSVKQFEKTEFGIE
jgi:hypothetical protein